MMGHIEQEIEVMAPIDRCYQLWTDFESIPKWAPQIREIRRTDEPDVWHWELQGPLTFFLEFDTQVDLMKPDEVVSWHTVGHSDVQHAGTVMFEFMGTNHTRIRVAIDYHTPGGKLGEFVADWVENPARIVEADLYQFKVLAEVKAAEINTSTYPNGVRREDV